MGPDREAGELFRAGGEFSGFNFASFPCNLETIGRRWKWLLEHNPRAQHKLLVLLRRNVKALFLQRFVSHAARMMRRNADEEEEERGVVGFFLIRCWLWNFFDSMLVRCFDISRLD